VLGPKTKETKPEDKNTAIVLALGNYLRRRLEGEYKLGAEESVSKRRSRIAKQPETYFITVNLEAHEPLAI
jgi:hypothetical protein